LSGFCQLTVSNLYRGCQAIVSPKICKTLGCHPNLTHLKNLIRYAMRNKNLYVIIIVLLAVLLIAVVLWVFDIRINKIEKSNQASISAMISSPDRYD
jgi:hypothetical protein